MATQLQIKRSSITGRTPNTTSSGNTTYIAAGELAVNLTDGKLFTSNGTTLITVGSNLESLSVNSVSLTGQLTVNSDVGTSGQVLTSGGSGNVYWSTVASGTITLTANSTDTQTFYFPMSNATSGSWSNAVLDTTDLSYIPSSGLLSLASANVSSSLNVVGAATVNGALAVNNTAATGNTTVTGFVNASSYGRFGGTVNATSFNSTGTATSTFANNVTVTGVTNTVSFNQTGTTTSTFANNVTITGTANAAALNILGVAATGNTTVTGFVNASSYGRFNGVVNATSFNSTGTATSTFANNVTITGTANVIALNVTGTTPVSANGGFGTRVTIIADAASVTINTDTTDVAIQTNTQAAGTLTINQPTGTPVNGQKLIFRLQSTNIQTLSWDSIFVGSNDLGIPSSSSGSSKYDYVGFIYNATASKWQMLAKNFGF